MSAIPAPYANTVTGFLGGHYAVAQASGAVTGTLAANAKFASFRWAPSNTSSLAMITRIKVGLSVLSALSTATSSFDASATIARGFTVDFTTNSTPVNLATVVSSNSMLGTMAPSQLGANGPRILTTAAMSGDTETLDSAPFAVTPLHVASASASIGNADLRTLYEYTGLQQHPLILGNNMGVILRFLTGFAISSSTVTVYTQWEWAELASF